MQETAPPARSTRMTPMMEQYIEIKAANPDCLLFYRMGDFYELFFDDASVASRALGITLTKRGKHNGADIPMCGVPVHAADDYLQRLIALGHRVAVCEQTEDPAEAKKRGHKAVVRREVVRLVTPGTLTEDTLLESGAANHLAALARTRDGQEPGGRLGLAWIDMSTGLFQVTETAVDRLNGDLARLDPSEILVPDALYGDPAFSAIFANHGAALTPLAAAYFDGATAETRLTDYFNVKTLEAYGTFSRVECAAAAAILAYVDKTQVGARPPLRPPTREIAGDRMQIDAATRSNLELMRTLSGARKGSLIHAVDRTVTGPGSRLLASRLASPLTDKKAIIERHDSVGWFVGDGSRRAAIRGSLRAAPDIARALTRLSLDRGGPRDLLAVATGLAQASILAEHLAAGTMIPDRIAARIADLQAAPHDLGGDVRAAIEEAPPLLKRDGGFVRAGYADDLDAVRALRDESRSVIAGLQADYGRDTDIKSLKIRHNNVLGYFIEVTALHADKLFGEPHNQTFIHRQTLANAVRFTTTELADLASRIANAGEQALAIELRIFDDLVERVRAEAPALQAVAAALADLDVAAGLAELAETENYCRPAIDETLDFAVEDGRHPVVEQALRDQAADPFVANSCDLSPVNSGQGQIWLLTGPNMAGKSTFLRQNALIALLAQMGSFVPAKSARIGIVDRLFSRVGAADDLARGRSTFMVEMVETAAILNQAGERALVILDEIGRGTATYDGLSIAWATIEHLHDVNGARTLFATHYHELTALAGKLDRLKNATVRVTEWKGDVVFLHEIVAGSADRSYGIQVARLAGLPDAVVRRAKLVLDQLEETADRAPASALVDDLPLFSVTRAPQAAPAEADPVLEALDAINPDELTPRGALDVLYDLKSKRAAKPPGKSR